MNKTGTVIVLLFAYYAFSVLVNYTVKVLISLGSNGSEVLLVIKPEHTALSLSVLDNTALPLGQTEPSRGPCAPLARIHLTASCNWVLLRFLGRPLTTLT
uniref:Uncharacterized protein n=1 Tax=Rhodnius prolixus TaxID=13249 RepID=T1HPJ4_RHOPR